MVVVVVVMSDIDETFCERNISTCISLYGSVLFSGNALKQNEPW